MSVDRPYHILLVEDSPTQAAALQDVLEAQGWRARVVLSGDEALDALNESIPDLVIADVNLPGMKGDELCRRVRMNVSARSVPILIRTSDESEAGQLRGLESGADDYVSKSEDTEILLLRARALLRKSRFHEYLTELRGHEAFHQARLLAVDDSPTYLEFVAGELQREGYVVERASSGSEGLERFGADSFDCVLVDLVMPEMDGITVCRKIDEERRSMENPPVVLILTAHDTREEMTRGLEAGADDFVGKSTDMAVLKARIRALLRRKFFQEENRRIMEELANRELEAVRARTAKEAAEARAAMAEELTATNRKLEETNRQLRATQVQLVHSEKMAGLGQLVAGIAHEINNPLSFALNNLFTMDRRVRQLLDPDAGTDQDLVRRSLEKIKPRLEDSKAGLERVKELVQKLRIFSRLDEGEFKTVDVHESIDAALLFLKHRMRDRIEVERHYEFPSQLSCYAGELNQVFLNLLSNAVDAIEGPGKITIRTGKREGRFELSIRDTGKGVPEGIRERIFDPFFTTKPVGKGTGLGLAISHQIVEAHRGSIEVRDDEAGGAEFLVEIPLDLSEKATP